MSCKNLIFPVILLIVFAACNSKPKAEPRRYDFEGKIVSIDAAKKSMTIAHKDIPGFMKGMTMDFDIKNNDFVFNYAKPGDQINAVLVMDPDGAYLDKVSVVQVTPESGSSTSSAHVPQVGDEVPRFSFTNQSGKKGTLDAFRGRPVLLTFIYTRCPLPDYCIRMSSNFAQIEKQLKESDTKLYERLQVVSVSIDPEFDTPKVLKEYGKNYAAQVDPNFTHWWFVSASPEETRKFADFFGLTYVRESNQITHSLRTVLIGPEGKIVALYNGNDWKPEDAIRDLKAMK